MSDFEHVELIHVDGRRFVATTPRELNDLLLSGKYRRAAAVKPGAAATPAAAVKPVESAKPAEAPKAAGK